MKKEFKKSTIENWEIVLNDENGLYMYDVICDYPKSYEIIQNLLLEEKQKILNKIHAIVCDLATDKGKDLTKEDCLELIRYQIERIYGKKLSNLPKVK